MYTRPLFPKVKTIYSERLASTDGSSPSVVNFSGYQPFTVECTTGIVYISSLSTAPGTTDCWMLEEGDTIDLIAQYLALVSTSTTASYQMLVYES